MPSKHEATTYIEDDTRTLAELQLAGEQAALETSGSADDLKKRLSDYLTGFDDSSEIVCLNPEPSA